MDRTRGTFGALLEVGLHRSERQDFNDEIYRQLSASRKKSVSSRSNGVNSLLPFPDILAGRSNSRTYRGLNPSETLASQRAFHRYGSICEINGRKRTAADKSPRQIYARRQGRMKTVRGCRFRRRIVARSTTTPNMKRDREAHAREGRKKQEASLTASANEPPIDESLIAWHRNADIAYKLPRYRA